jgi:GT2 family glycosyltransferase
VLCDHDRVIGSDEYDDPSFTPGWDPDLIQSVDYIDTAFLASRSLVQRHRNLSTSCSSLHDWLKSVAVHERDLVTQHLSESVVHLPQRDVTPPPAARSSRTLVAAPDVAVIVPNRNRPDLLKQCLKFMDFENGFKSELIIVDNASDDPSLSEIYVELKARHGAKIVNMNQKFNFARMVNLGVAAARAETFMLLNNDVEITAPGLVEQLLAHALRPEVGVVGTKLLNGDGTVQHGGMLLEEGPAGVQTMLARHVLRGAARDDPGYLGALSCVRNYQAVTGALMAGRRDVFLEVGGFDEVHLPVEFNDVDYCLRVRRAGYRVVCLPLDGIFHIESSTRGSELSPEIVCMRQAAMAIMAERWREAFRNDPYRNRWGKLGDVPHVRFPWSADGAGA